MPLRLRRGKSRAVVSANIRTLSHERTAEGAPRFSHPQAIAIALKRAGTCRTCRATKVRAHPRRKTKGVRAHARNQAVSPRAARRYTVHVRSLGNREYEVRVLWKNPLAQGYLHTYEAPEREVDTFRFRGSPSDALTLAQQRQPLAGGQYQLVLEHDTSHPYR